MAQGYKLLLISKTSYDKHATINTLTKEDTIDVSEAPNLNTAKYPWGKGHTVVDTPGLMDVDKLERVRGILEKFRSQIPCLPFHSHEGFNAIGLVMRYPVRMTPEESTSIKTLLNIIGGNKFQRFGILIFTNGVAFKKQQGDAKEKFIDYLKSEVSSAKSFMGDRKVNKGNVHEHLGNLISFICSDEHCTTNRCMFIDNDDTEGQDVYVNEVEKLVRIRVEATKGDTYTGKWIDI